MTQRPQPVGKPGRLEHDYNVTPGEVLRRELAARGVSQADLAARAGISAKHLNQVVQGAVPLSTDTALRLERTLGLPATILTQLDAVHQAKMGRTKARQRLSEYHGWFAEFPLAELISLNIVKVTATVEDQIEQLLEFFGVADPSSYRNVYAETVQSFRRAQHLSVNPPATAVWLRLAERKAEDVNVSAYKKLGFIELLKELPTLTIDPINESFPVLQTRCAEVGVAVVHTQSVAGTRASAAVRWLGPDRPIIALTSRGKHEDGFWWGFFHEAGHVVLHPRRKSVIEFEGDDDEDGAETQANSFAKAILLRGRQKELNKLITREQIQKFAADLDVHPGIPASIRAYEIGPEGWRTFAKLRRKFDDSMLD
jgi:HTH-type transcriptional regulator / antitoxin HigA